MKLKKGSVYKSPLTGTLLVCINADGAFPFIVLTGSKKGKEARAGSRGLKRLTLIGNNYQERVACKSL